MDSLTNLLEDAINNLQKEQCKVTELRNVLEKIKEIFGDDDEEDN
jgi:hypothetical protein